MNRKISDYSEIIRVYNTDGRSQAYAYIRKQYDVKNPYGIISRIKQSGIFKYDEETDRFLESSNSGTDSVFIGLNELCQSGRNAGSSQAIDNGQNMEKLIKDLIEDRLVQLSHYIQMNQLTRTVLIDHTSMKADGYQVIIH